MASSPDISLIVPVFNEEASVDGFLARVIPILDGVGSNWELIFVNDGSRDKTLDKIRAAHARDKRIQAIDFSRNFGKEIALCAGLDFACGRAVIPMDVDLQDPPELIPEMVARWREGFDMVLAQRTDRTSDKWTKRTTAALFYSLIAKVSNVQIPANVGDYRLLDASVVAALRSYRERERFMKGIFASVGYRTATITYARETRIDGETKFGWFKLLRLAVDGLVSFSVVPLKIWTFIGAFASLSAVIYAAFIIMRTLISGADVPGYASLVVVILLFNGLTLTGLGIQGEYIARIYSEVKARPLYLVRETIGTLDNDLGFDSERKDAGSAKSV
jgi:glycosyltransferase involved in cell wall biosynthesis